MAACVASGTPQPGNVCRSCQPLVNDGAWSPKSGPCDDADGCTSADSCVAGQCTGGQVSCSDGKACTTDTCLSPSGTCQHSVAAGWCLILGTCVSGGTPNPANTCTACQPATDDDAWSPREAPCEDGSQCTGGDACQDGQCASGAPVSCDDGKWCTADSCAPASGCQHGVVESACLIDGACVAAGTPKPDNPCLACQPEVDDAAWTAYAEGTCGPLPHASAMCSFGKCIVAECDEDWTDKNADPSDGCEAAPYVLWVDWLSEWGPEADGSPERPFADIHEALVAAAPGATIRVREGFYEGAVRVETPNISIIGAGVGKVTVTTSKANGPIGFDIAADDVRIESLTSNGGQLGIRAVGTAQIPIANLFVNDVAISQVQGSTSGADAAAIYLSQTTGAVVTGAHVDSVTGENGTNVSCSPTSAGGYAQGLRVESSTGCTVDGLRVAKLTGGLGPTSSCLYHPGGPGGVATGVFVIGSSSVSINNLETNVVTAGDGGLGDGYADYRGKGGLAEGIRIDTCTDCSVRNVVITSTKGGKGGVTKFGGAAACITVSASPKFKVRSVTCDGVIGGATYGGAVVPPAIGLDVQAGQTTPVQLLDSIITSTGSNCLYSNSNNPSTTLSASYSNLFDCGSGGTASNATVLPNCLSVDPLYVDAPAGNLHLKPSSPCIDTGKPATGCSFEPVPNGCRVNMGAYGNTPEATSKPGASHCPICP